MNPPIICIAWIIGSGAPLCCRSLYKSSNLLSRWVTASGWEHVKTWVKVSSADLHMGHKDEWPYRRWFCLLVFTNPWINLDTPYLVKRGRHRNAHTWPFQWTRANVEGDQWAFQIMWSSTVESWRLVHRDCLIWDGMTEESCSSQILNPGGAIGNRKVLWGCCLCW